jgi:hypothetical protein
MKAIKLKMKHPMGRRYRIVNSELSSQKKSSRAKRSNPKSISKIPVFVYFDTLLKVTILMIILLILYFYVLNHEALKRIKPG